MDAQSPATNVVSPLALSSSLKNSPSVNGPVGTVEDNTSSNNNTRLRAMSASTAHYGGGGGGDVPIEPVRQVVGFDVGNTQGAAIHNNMDNADGMSATMNEYRQEGHNYDANQSGTAAATSAS